MKDHYEQKDESCNLPNHCECWLCKHWDEDGSDRSRDPVWKTYEDDEK